MIILPLAMHRIAEQNNLPIIPLVLLLGLLFVQTNCSAFAQNRKIKLNETLTLQPGETVETEDSKLKVKFLGAGRDIYEYGEEEYAELQIRLNESEQMLKITEWKNRKRAVGDFIIELINAESFGKQNCELKISRRE